jgi:predicted lipoprotein with Yx(FWY)xxD motif
LVLLDMLFRLLPLAAIVAAAFAGCGSSNSSAKDGPVVLSPTTRGAGTSTASNQRGPKLKVIDSDYGRILADGRGRALYLFTSDRGQGSRCSGDCATAWPPFIVKAAPTAVSGAKPGLVGITRRSGGRLQVTYAGHPVYYYRGDRSPGEVNCQAAVEFGGHWYVLRSNGKAVR